MSKRIEDAKAAAWNQIKETMKAAVVRVCQDGRALHTGFSEADHKGIDDRLTRLLEKVIQRMEPEAKDIVAAFLGFPGEMMENLARLYVKHFRACVIEDKDNPAYRESQIETLLDHSAARVEEILLHATAPDRAVKQALEKGDYAGAEQIIRGDLAMHPDNVAMFNYLFTVACLSGNADLFVEALNISKGRPHFHVPVELVNRNAISTFLGKAIAENVLVGVSPFAFGGLTTSPSQISEAQKKHFKEAVDAMISHAVEEIIKRMAGPETWTRESFVAMCRGALTSVCAIYERWLLGTSFVIQWKGEPAPDFMKGRIQQM